MSRDHGAQAICLLAEPVLPLLHLRLEFQQQLLKQKGLAVRGGHQPQQRSSHNEDPVGGPEAGRTLRSLEAEVPRSHVRVNLQGLPQRPSATRDCPRAAGSICRVSTEPPGLSAGHTQMRTCWGPTTEAPGPAYPAPRMGAFRRIPAGSSWVSSPCHGSLPVSPPSPRQEPHPTPAGMLTTAWRAGSLQSLAPR